MDRNALPYQAYFCEENIWHFANEYLKTNPEATQNDDATSATPKCFVLFFINAPKQVTLLNQRSFGELGVGIWDYHVVFFDLAQSLIFDFDTVLPFPADAKMYFEETFPEIHFSSAEILQSLEMTPARIRVIPAEQYLAHFSSDRSHMLDEKGLPSEPFPEWPAIHPGESAVDLRSYWDLDEEVNTSEVLDAIGFCKKFLIR